ncbi:hypothetical protein JB92DRAFT_2839296 [Gautieria morchelliformis]|nr:hypothetical protein JB92DRAFT_2839296 [Gautieria morchelliformis]
MEFGLQTLHAQISIRDDSVGERVPWHTPELATVIFSARGRWSLLLDPRGCTSTTPQTPTAPRKHTSTTFAVITSGRRSMQQPDPEDEDLPALQQTAGGSGSKKSRAHCRANTVTAEALTAGRVQRWSSVDEVAFNGNAISPSGDAPDGWQQSDSRVMRGVQRARWVGGKVVVFWVKAYELLDYKIWLGKCLR